MASNEKKITPVQLMLIIIQAQIGVSVLSLPYDIYRFAKGDSWITILASGFIIQLLILLYWSLLRRYATKNLFELSTLLTGKIIGNCINIIYIVFATVFCGLDAYMVFFILQKWAYSYTPKWVMLLLILVPVLMLAKSSIQVIARFCTLTIALHPILLIILLVVGMKSGRLDYFLPLWQSNVMELVLSLKGALTAFIGIELIMILYPQVTGTDQEKLKWITLSNFYVTLVYLFIVIVCLFLFRKMDRLSEPVLMAVKALSLHVVERLDLIFMSIWIDTSIGSLALYAYVSSLGMSQLFHRKQHTKITWLSGFLIFLIALSIESLMRREIYISTIQILSILIYFLFPLLLLALSFFQMRKRRLAK